jgi:hypothetical protein
MSEKKKIPKFSFLKITMSTSNISHTALYRHACSMPGFKEGTFQKMYYTNKTYPDKDKTSREYDEVISRSCIAMGLKVMYVNEKYDRYAVIYQEFRTTKTYQEQMIREKLELFEKRFQRRQPPLLIPVVKISDRKEIGTI